MIPSLQADRAETGAKHLATQATNYKREKPHIRTVRKCRIFIFLTTTIFTSMIWSCARHSTETSASIKFRKRHPRLRELELIFSLI
jgi:hypothetical protein